MGICLQNKLTISCRNAKYTPYRLLGSVVLDVNFRQCHIVQCVKEDSCFVELLSGNEPQLLIVL